jgi:hypothetical protein
MRTRSTDSRWASPRVTVNSPRKPAYIPLPAKGVIVTLLSLSRPGQRDSTAMESTNMAMLGCLKVSKVGALSHTHVAKVLYTHILTQEHCVQTASFLRHYRSIVAAL